MRGAHHTSAELSAGSLYGTVEIIVETAPQPLLRPKDSTKLVTEVEARDSRQLDVRPWKKTTEREGLAIVLFWGHSLGDVSIMDSAAEDCRKCVVSGTLDFGSSPGFKRERFRVGTNVFKRCNLCAAYCSSSADICTNGSGLDLSAQIKCSAHRTILQMYLTRITVSDPKEHAFLNKQ
eukprot:IDg22897t1